jgi:cytochrome oxidase Cu insertion factor (SCO1/SenC/PrrC family)
VNAAVSPTPPARPSLFPLWAMLFVFSLPVISAWVYYFNPELLPAKRANRGELINPVRPWPPELALDGTDGRPLPEGVLQGHWTLLVAARTPCDAACRALLAELRQVRLALGESGQAVERVLLLVGPPGGDVVDALGARVARLDASRGADLEALLGPGQAIWNRVYVVDPMGNLMMRYAENAAAKDVLKDMERLLKASKNWIKGAQYGHR